MARLYSNENFPRPAAEELRRLGHDILTVLEAGNAGQAIPAGQVLDFARGQQRAVITLNRKHFIRLHQNQPDHSGIIVCTYDPDFPGQARRIHEALEGMGSLEGKLIRVNRPDSPP